MCEIRTPRLVLRPFTPSDAPDLFSIRGDGQAMRFWDHPGDRDLEQTAEVARLFAGEMASGDALYMTARLPEGGFVGLFDLGELRGPEPDLGFMVVRRLWGRGYGAEGAQAMLEQARRMGSRRLKARIHAGNEASRRLLLNLGFRERSRVRAMEVRPGRLVDCLILTTDL